MKKSYGLIIVPRDPLDYEYQLGASKIHKVIHRPNGQWDKDFPEGEIQRKNETETSSCVSFGTLNITEILEKVKFNSVSNYADRYLAIVSNTSPSGNDPKKVAQAFRDKGAIPEELLPFSEDIKSQIEYLSPNPLPSEYTNEGKSWLKRYEISYEWVKTDPKHLMEELQYSPLGISVEAWQQDENSLYYSEGGNDNHWTVLGGYKENEYWLIYDSYSGTGGSYCKKLRWDYPFGLAMSYSLKKKETQEEKKGFWRQLLEALFGSNRIQ